MGLVRLCISSISRSRTNIISTPTPSTTNYALLRLRTISAQTLKPREATDVDAEVVEPAAAVLLELTLKLFLGLRYGQTQTAQGTPTPGPPQTLSGDRDGNFPCWNTVRAFARHAIRLNPVENGP